MEEPGRLQSMGLQSLTWLSTFTFFLSISKTSLPKTLSPSSVRQSCMIPCNPMDYNLSSSSVHGTFPARILEWVSISFPTPRLYPIKIESLNSNTNITISSLCGLNPIISNLGTFHVGVLLCASYSVKIYNQFCLSHWKHGAFIKKQKWKALTYPQEDFPGGSVVKNPPARCRFDPLVGKIPGGGNGNPQQYSCLEKPMDRRAWWTISHRVGKSQTQLSTHTSLGTVFNLLFKKIFFWCGPF